MSRTPGPWTTEPGRFWICDVGNNADDPGVWSAFPVADGMPFPFGDKVDDARLIAAAPDLLEACRLVLRCKGLGVSEATAFDAVRAAIAKAEGQS